MTAAQLVQLRKLGSRRKDDPRQLSLFDVRPAPQPARRRQDTEQELWLDEHPGSRTYQAPQLRGYADFPGSGPAGETCGSCAHHVTFHKRGQDHHRCFWMERLWGRNDAADIDPDARSWRHWAPAVVTNAHPAEKLR